MLARFVHVCRIVEDIKEGKKKKNKKKKKE